MQSSLSVLSLEAQRRVADVDSESVVSGSSLRSGGGSESSLPLSTASPLPVRTGCRPSRRRGIGENPGRWKRGSSKGCSDYVPLFPNPHTPMNIVLEPYPNRRVRSLCVARGMMVTAHRNGIRIYRQRFIKPTSAPSPLGNRRCDVSECGGDLNVVDIRTGLWENVDFRSQFQLQDAYICAAAEPVFADDRVLPLKWNRYVAAACGNDRTHYSVCVLSTSANFLLHHELHSNNRIVALNFTLVALETNPESRRYRPFVVSVDEIGEVVIFDVEGDCAAKLTVSSVPTVPNGESAKADFAAKGVVEDDNGRVMPTRNSGSVGEGQHRSPSCSDPMKDCPYRLESGVASNVCLVGPCQVMCRHCSNWSGPSPGTFLLGLYISSHAHCSAGQAELHVCQLRVLYSYITRRAVVVCETPVVRECAPPEVCGVGCALLLLPRTSGLPSSVLVGRPRLRFWRMSGCSGKLLQVNRVYQDRDGSGKGARMQWEYFVRIVPLGRQVLQRDKSTSWFCLAALTENDTVLLLGETPQRTVGTSAPSEDCQLPEPPVKPEALMSAAEYATLNAWLDEVEQPKAEGAKSDILRPLHHQQPGQRLFRAGEVCSEAVSVVATPLLSSTEPSHCFTVLMVLAKPNVAKTPGRREDENQRVRQLLWVAQSNELLFFMGGDEVIYSIKLPFVWPTVCAEVPAQNVVDESQSAQKEKQGVNGWFSSAITSGSVFSLGIARPLMSVVLNFTGETEPEKMVLPPVVQQHHESLVVPEVVVNDGRSATHSPSAVTVDIDANGNTITRRRKRRGMNRSTSSAASFKNSTAGETFGSTAAVHSYDDSVRRAYLAEEHGKFLNSPNLRGPQGGGRGYLPDAEIVAQVEQLCLTDEPLQRNGITYEWSDAHNLLYVQFESGLKDIVGCEGPNIRASGVRGHSDMGTKGRQETLESLVGLPVLKALNDCIHSVGFMQAYRATHQKVKRTRGVGEAFDFISYFTSGVPPQSLLDMQEEDRCNFELADLRVAFEADMRKLIAEETIRIYENEELTVLDGGGRRRWTSHETFPFDDENGEVVDINSLNATAALGNTVAVAGESPWRWAVEENLPPRRIGSKLAHKRLLHWTIGEWMYAVRWPTPEEEQLGTFSWSKNNSDNTAKVRRRCLTRKRINMVVEAARQERRRVYERDMAELREELGL